jgi:hypothetical protein
MDTSETYIKMSVGAQRFLPAHKWQDGDYCYFPITGEVDVYCHHCEEEFSTFVDKPKMLPLLRQDQLLGMVEGHPLEILDKFHTFCMWDESLEDTREKLLPISMEQLGLAFVEKCNYQRTWDNGDWVKT